MDTYGTMVSTTSACSPVDLVQELLDDNGILPILSSDAGEGSASLASAVEYLSDTISVASGVGAAGAATAFPAPSGSGVRGSISGDGADGANAADTADTADAPDAPDPENGDIKQGSWEKGSAISADASVRHQVEGRLGTGTRGDREAVDEVDVIMQVCPLSCGLNGFCCIVTGGNDEGRFIYMWPSLPEHVYSFLISCLPIFLAIDSCASGPGFNPSNAGLGFTS